MNRPSCFRTFLLLVASFVAMIGTRSVASAQTPKRQIGLDSTYSKLVEQIRRGDTLVDFHLLRMAYAGSQAYDPGSTEDAFLRRRLKEAMGSGDLQVITALSDSLLAHDPVDVEGHVLAAYAARQRGDSVSARRHAAIARGLGRSFDGINRGTGLTSPIFIIAASEEEAYGSLIGLQYTDSTKLVDCPTGYCDVVVFRNPRTGTDTTLYFDLTLQVRWMLQHSKK